MGAWAYIKETMHDRVEPCCTPALTTQPTVYFPYLYSSESLTPAYQLPIPTYHRPPTGLSEGPAVGEVDGALGVEQDAVRALASTSTAEREGKRPLSTLHRPVSSTSSCCLSASLTAGLRIDRAELVPHMCVITGYHPSYCQPALP